MNDNWQDYGMIVKALVKWSEKQAFGTGIGSHREVNKEGDVVVYEFPSAKLTCVWFV